MANKLNFDSILIVSYGRSGSTLMQGILNSHEEILIRGENYNFCFGLYKSYKSLKKTRQKKQGVIPENPFFGSVYYDEHYFISMAKKTVKNLLFGDQIGNKKIECYGFKEIRYVKNPESLESYLNFLKLIFPNSAFIFNTRNIDDVIESRKKLQWNGILDKSGLEKTEAAFLEFGKKYPDCSFHISYEDVVEKKERLSLLHSFLGLTYSEEKINSVLSFRHSFKPTQDKVLKLKSPHKIANIESKGFRILSFEDRYLNQLERDLTDSKQKIKSLENSLFYKITKPFRW